MDPYHFHHIGGRHRSGPSRILWFVLGAATATLCIKRKGRVLWFVLGAATAKWWFKHKGIEQCTSRHCKCRPNPNDRNAVVTSSGSENDTDIPTSSSNIPTTQIVNDTSGVAVSINIRGAMGDYNLRIPAEARDAMAELAESTLDSVLSTAEALKVTLAAHRNDRETIDTEEKSTQEERKNSP